MKLKIVGAIVALTLVGGFAVACEDDDDEPSADEATAQLCSDLSSLQVALGNLRSITADSTVDELEAARDDVQSALEDVRSSAEDVEEAEIAAVEDAYADLDSAVNDVEGDQSVGAALEDIATQVEAIDDAWDELFQGLRCVERTPTGGTVTAVSGTVVSGATGTAEANATSTAEAEASLTPEPDAETPTQEPAGTETSVASPEPSPDGTAAATATP
jgi:hypothetical protein